MSSDPRFRRVCCQAASRSVRPRFCHTIAFVTRPTAGTLAIDVGGTFTDITFADAASGATWVAKTPSTPGALEAGFITAIRKVLALAGRETADVLRVFHGTTTATNAI